jgi:hypothetical protein
MMERRFESRFLCADLVKVDWLAGTSAGALRTVEAVLEDISALGACVQVDEPIPPGATISISVRAGETVRFSGHVSYCVFRDYGYFVGIRFSNETRWSSGVFQPRHLTSLEELILRAKPTLN